MCDRYAQMMVSIPYIVSFATSATPHQVPHSPAYPRPVVVGAAEPGMMDVARRLSPSAAGTTRPLGLLPKRELFEAFCQRRPGHAIAEQVPACPWAPPTEQALHTPTKRWAPSEPEDSPAGSRPRMQQSFKESPKMASASVVNLCRSLPSGSPPAARRVDDAVRSVAGTTDGGG